MARLLFWMAVGLASLAPADLRADEENFGTLRGKFVFRGEAPKMTKLNITRDAEFCTRNHPHNEQLLVGEGGGVANVVMYLVGDPQDMNKPVEPIHPSYQEIEEERVVFDNKDCRFEPRVALLWTKQPLVLKNSDPIAHNAFSTAFNNPNFNPTIPAGGSVDMRMQSGEKLPVRISCIIHPWMQGFIVVRPDPYMAATGEDGTFEIKNIPAGEHTVQLWQETIGYLTKVTLDGKPTEHLGIRQRGQYTIQVKPGDNDLGEIVIDAADYARKLGTLR